MRSAWCDSSGWHLAVALPIAWVAGAACLSTPDPAAGDAAVDVPVATCVGGFEGGATSGTQVFGTGRLALSPGSSQGTFTSPVFASTAARTYRTLRWQTVRPSLKPLPAAGASESAYEAGNAVMTANQLLLRFDDTAPYDDVSGNGLSATCSATPFDQCPARVPGLFRRGVELDVDADTGSIDDNDRLRLASSATLETPRITVETWVRPTRMPSGGARMMIVDKGWQSPVVAPFTSYSIEYNADGTFRCYVDSDAPGEELVDGSIVAAAAAWHHVACTYDGLALRLYVDGSPDGSLAATGVLRYGRSGSDELVLGTYADSQFLDGAVDELAIHDEALSDAELLEHARRGLLRLSWQIRVCDDPACEGEDAAWRGPDATAATAYSEACDLGAGHPALAVNDLDCDGDGAPDDGADLAVPPTRYVQLRASLDSQRPGDSPELVSYELCE